MCGICRIPTCMCGYVSDMGDGDGAGSMSSADLIDSAVADLFHSAGAGVNVVFDWALRLNKSSANEQAACSNYEPRRIVARSS